MEDHEIKYQEVYERAFLEVHFSKLLNVDEKDLKFEMNITKQCFENAVKDKRFSQEFLNKFNHGRNTI
jgi:uncharacterized membrane protein